MKLHLLRKRGCSSGLLTPETQAKILDALEAGHHYDTAAMLAGVHRSTFYRWLAQGENDPDSIYGELWFKVKVSASKAEDQLLRKVAAGQPGWQSSCWILERRFAGKWGKIVDLTRESPVRAAQVINELVTRLLPEDEAAKFVVAFEAAVAAATKEEEAKKAG